MILQGPWNIPQWQDENPTFAFDVASQPLPNSGPPRAISYAPGPAPPYWLYAKSASRMIAGDIFTYLGTEGGQAAMESADRGEPVAYPKANQDPSLDPRARKAFALFDQQMRLRPSPNVRNPEAEKVTLEQKPLTPNASDTIQGIYTGQLGDPKKAMQDLKDRSDKELERAIKAAQAKGAKVSRDDWVFPNWDRSKDYVDADYATLGK